MSGETCDLHAQPYEGTQSDALPSEDLLDVIASIKVLDKDKKEHLFSDLILHEDPKAQTFVFFIRHFFCPVSQHSSCHSKLNLTTIVLPNLDARSHQRH